MGFIDDILADDLAANLDADLFPEVESITYTPHGGSPSAIKAAVFRLGAVDINGQPIRQVRVVVSRNDVPTVNVNGDKFTLATRKGETATTDHRCVMVEAEDAGGLTLIIQ